MKLKQRLLIELQGWVTKFGSLKTLNISLVIFSSMIGASTGKKPGNDLDNFFKLADALNLGFFK